MYVLVLYEFCTAQRVLVLLLQSQKRCLTRLALMLLYSCCHL